MKSAIFSKMMRSSQRLPIVIYGVAIIFFMSFSVTDLHGQFKKPKYLKPTITLAYEKIPEKSFHDTAGHFGFDKALLSLRIPLYTQFLKGKKAGSFGFWGIMLNIDGAGTWHRFSWLPSRQIFIEGTGGLSAWYYGGRRSVYLISINSRMAEDIYSVNNPGLFYSGFILRNHNISRILSYTLGISYSHVYGRGLPLPVIGATFIIGKRNRIHFMLPFRADYNLRFSERSRLVLFLRPNGGLINVSNRNRYPDYPSIFSFRQRVFRAGVLVELGIGSA